LLSAHAEAQTAWGVTSHAADASDAAVTSTLRDLLVNELSELLAQSGAQARALPAECQDVSCARGASQVAGAAVAVHMSVHRLGQKYIVSASAVDVGSGASRISQRMDSRRVEELDLVIKRLAVALVTREPVEEGAELETITESEGRAPVRRRVDQFLFFTGSTRGEVVAAQVGNFHHADRPDFEDFGDAMFRGDGGVGYIRLDWFTPDGLPTWGDGRLTILGSEGFIELRKYIDVLGRPGGNHLFITDGDGVRYIDCDDVELPYGPRLVDDVLDRTETAMSQAHCFLATELALTAQARATNAVMKA
jgi:hypothetical protein